MSTHNIPFQYIKKKITLKYTKFATMGLFPGTQERVRNSRGTQAIRITEVLLYVNAYTLLFFCHFYKGTTLFVTSCLLLLVTKPSKKDLP